jgi:glutamyl-tRNA synthetase
LSIPYRSIDDQVLVKSDGLPTYHFGVVVDDHLMKITHVLRGEEYISSTPKDILMYKAFGWDIPVWVHMPMIVGDNGKKFGKRNGSQPAVAYLEQGYLQEAIINYVALLGWSPGSDLTVMNREDLVEHFTLEKIQKSPAKFDPKKFEWINGEHIRLLKVGELTDKFLEWLKRYSEEKIETNLRAYLMKDTGLKDKVALVQERAKTFVEMADQLKFFYIVPTEKDYKEQEIKKISDQLIEELIAVHKTVDISDQEAWENAVRGLADSCSYKAGDVFMQVRIAIAGSRFSPPLRESMEILGKDEILKRLETYSKA